MRFVQGWMVAGALALGCASPPACADPAADRAAVAALDTAYQAAVKANDAAAMGQILAPDFVLVLSSGNVVTRAELLADASNRTMTYERQEEDAGTQTVRVYGDTAIVTARLWIKGSQGASTMNFKLWFSDTYVRTPAGWRYVFGQAAGHVPVE